MFMITYTISIMVLFGLMILASDDGKSRFTVFFELLLFTPIFGRILGWW